MKIKDCTEEEIRQAIKVSKSKRSTLKFLGIPEKNLQANYELDIFIKNNQIDISHFILYKDLSLINSVIKECYSFSEVATAIGYGKTSRNINSRSFNKIKRYIEKHKLDTSHFNYLGRRRNSGKKYSNENIFKLGAEVSGATLKKRYLKIRNKEYKCDMNGCNISEWLGKPIVLQLDHINGISDDNRFENLRLLCPNCHTQTETFAGKNSKN